MRLEIARVHLFDKICFMKVLTEKIREYKEVKNDENRNCK